MIKKIVWTLCIFFITFILHAESVTKAPPIALKDLFKIDDEVNDTGDLEENITFSEEETNDSSSEITLLRNKKDQPDSVPNEKSIQIQPPEAKEQSWLTNPTNSLNAKEHVEVKFDEPILIKMIQETPKKVSSDAEEGIVDIGFILVPKQHPNTIVTYVNQLRETNETHYALNFDGSKLVYFDLKSLNPTLKILRQNNAKLQKRVPLFVNEGKVILSKSIKNVLMQNAINTAGVREANYIFLKEDSIVLDNKEMRINNLSEKNAYLTQAVDAIKHTDTTADVPLNIQWRLRSSKTRNWY